MRTYLSFCYEHVQCGWAALSNNLPKRHTAPKSVWNKWLGKGAWDFNNSKVARRLGVKTLEFWANPYFRHPPHLYLRHTPVHTHVRACTHTQTHSFSISLLLDWSGPPTWAFLANIFSEPPVQTCHNTGICIISKWGRQIKFKIPSEIWISGKQQILF